jgi:hypothetical protein
LFRDFAKKRHTSNNSSSSMITGGGGVGNSWQQFADSWQQEVQQPTNNNNNWQYEARGWKPEVSGAPNRGQEPQQEWGKGAWPPPDFSGQDRDGPGYQYCPVPTYSSGQPPIVAAAGGSAGAEGLPDAFSDVNSNSIFKHMNGGDNGAGVQWDSSSETRLSNLLNLIHIMDSTAEGSSGNMKAAALTNNNNGGPTTIGFGQQAGGDRPTGNTVWPNFEPPPRPAVPPTFIPGGGRAITGGRTPVLQQPPPFLPPKVGNSQPPMMSNLHKSEPPPPLYADPASPLNFLRVNLRVPPPTHPPAVPLALPPPLHPSAAAAAFPFRHHQAHLPPPPPPPIGFPYPPGQILGEAMVDGAAASAGCGSIARFPPPPIPRHHNQPRYRTD